MQKLKIPLRGEKLLRAGAVFVLMTAVMPNLTYLGHGPTDPSHESPHSHGVAVADVGSTSDDAHVQHCHVGAAKCAGPQSLVGTWWVGEDPLVPAPALMRVPVDANDIEAIDSEPSRFLRPPQAGLFI